MRKPVAGIEPASGFSGANRERVVCSDAPIMPGIGTASKDERYPQFRIVGFAAITKSAPPLAASGGREAILDSVPSPRPRTSSFTNVKETTMTISHEQQVEELRAELRVVLDANERRQIAAELEMALAEIAVIEAEQDGRISGEPPF
nr:hypothetical protein RFYW14_04469 [Pseudorhizobium flavum]